MRISSTWTLREPVVVCGQISPWNFAAADAALKTRASAQPAVTPLRKPADRPPRTVCYWWLITERPPDGVVNVVTVFGPARATRSPRIRGRQVAFTGSN